MKNFTIIVTFLFSLLMIGCAGSQGNDPARLTDDIPNAVFTETTESLLEAANDTYEASDDLTLAAREAFIEHFSRGSYLHLPTNYQGAYFDEGDFVVQVSDDDHSDYDFLYELECARVETVKHTHKELEDLRDILWKILKDEHGTDVVSNGIDHKNNAIEIEVFDKYTDEEKAAIASYVEDYPVIIKYVDYHHTAI